MKTKTLQLKNLNMLLFNICKNPGRLIIICVTVLFLMIQEHAKGQQLNNHYTYGHHYDINIINNDESAHDAGLRIQTRNSNMFYDWLIWNNHSNGHLNFSFWDNNSHHDDHENDYEKTVMTVRGDNESPLWIYGRIRCAANNGGIWFSSDNTGFVGNNGDNIGFWANGPRWNAFQINKSSGFVGIGTTDPKSRLHVSGNMRLGLINNSNNNTAGYGSKLYFSGGGDWNSYDSENSDELWISRYNAANNKSELRLNLGDDQTFDDKFVVGYTNGSNWNPALTVGANGDMVVKNTIKVATSLSLTADKTNLIKFGNAGDYQFLHKASGIFGKPTLALHCSDQHALGFYSSGYKALFEVEGGTGNTYFEGNVGIGVNSGQEKLHVDGDIRIGEIRTPGQVGHNGTIHGNKLHFSGGGCWLSANSDNTDPIWIGRYNTNYDHSELRVSLGNDNTFDDKFAIGYLQNDNWHSAFSVGANGNVAIGTNSVPDGYKMAVNGKIKSKGVIVDPSNWADYVFEEDYDLKSIEEVDDFIQSNGHLPDVPSAQEVEETGVNVSEMQSTLLRKVEELTLYIIELHNEIETLKANQK